MIHDAEQALPPLLEADVCIAGAGPAGIVLALELAKYGHRVCLLEGGGRDSGGDAFDSYQGNTSGRPYGLSGSRLRWLGGTSNHWGGWVRPLDPVDFAAKPLYPVPGWPLSYAALEPWYAEAAR
jgi:choline dehydrogenase-like flavoprotein